jgi:hypothetical protein
MRPPRYVVQYEPKDAPSDDTVTRWQGDKVTHPDPGHLVTPSPCHLVRLDTQSRGEWGETLRVLLVTPACAAQAQADRFNAADRRQETDS